MTSLLFAAGLVLALLWPLALMLRVPVHATLA